ncbi:hypothetical protein MRX96_027594 [Rhipicephalus microplus]
MFSVFSVPLLYCNVAIGLAGTIYTALGGLRSVVWADCIQAAVMAATPLIIIGKVIYDSPNASPPLRPLSDFNVTHYIFSFVRTGFDQMAVQRFIAARTLQQAKRMAITGAVFVVIFLVMAAVGALDNNILVVPYFVKERLSDVTMLRGVFLAGLVGASTSTVSSIVNSHAATFYIDIVSPYIDMSEKTAVRVMRLLALASGTIMTLFAIAVPYLGTATRLFISLYSSAAGPFAGLILLAISSPWVNAKV